MTDIALARELDFGRTGDDVEGGFFAYHGLMAPGVRLFRSRTFGVRALIISLLFLLPIGFLSFQAILEKRSVIKASQQELQGLRYVRDLYGVLRATETVVQQTLAADPAQRIAARGQLETELKKLEQTEQALGAAIQTTKAYAEMRQQLQKADESAQGFSAFVNHSRLVKAQLHLLDAASDGSNLALDSDLTTYYLIDTLTKGLPALNERSVQTAAAALAVLRAKAMSPQLQRVFSDNEVMIDYHFGRLKSGLAKIAGARPDLAVALKSEAVVANSSALFKEVEKSVTDASELDADPAAFMALAEQALRSQTELSQNALQAINELVAERVSGQQRALLWLVGGVSLLLALVAYLFYAFYLVTNGGLRKTAEHLRSITQGDLSGLFKGRGADETAELMETLQEMQGSLRTMVHEVRTSAEHIVKESHQIAGGAADLAGRSSSSSASIESSVGAIEHIATALLNTAKNTDEAARIAAGNARVSEHGAVVVGNVVQTMQEIQQSSKRIGDIIGVIDGIAFQTNILALNAAVEAARAGEQGRGFAVVASEVRALAGRSTDAAREIKGLIASSLERVDAGTVVVKGAGDTMREMVANAKVLNDLLGQIAQASNEQNLAVAEVRRTVNELESSTQQNVELVEQTATSSNSLRAQSDHLITLVERFRLN
jgi:methyl-accepting chemotaxis protein